MAYNNYNQNERYEKYLEESGFYEEPEDDYMDARWTIIYEILPELRKLFPDREVHVPRGTSREITLYSWEYDPDKRDTVYISPDASSISYLGENPKLKKFVEGYSTPAQRLQNVGKIRGISGKLPTVISNIIARQLSGESGSIAEQKAALTERAMMPSSTKGGRRRKTRRHHRRRRRATRRRT
jgi:hypothetical protein